NGLDIGDQMRRGVVDQFGEWCGLPAPALVEQHDAVARRIEEAEVVRGQTGTRAAMQEHYRQAGRVAAFLHMQGVQRIDRQTPGPVRLDLGIQLAHGPGSLVQVSWPRTVARR